MQDSSIIKKWVDSHREWIILTIVLPVGFIYKKVQRFHRWWTQPDPLKHDERVNRIIKSIQNNNQRENGRKLRTDRRGESSLNTRSSDKSRSQRVVMKDMRSILGIDTEERIVRIEPFVTTGELAKYLDQRGWQVEATIEMEGATLGGLVLAVGMTTHSHHVGLLHDVVHAWEVVTGDGQLVRATRDDGEHSDLFRALPWSHGTLGMLVALELRIIPAPSHVRLVYRPFNDLSKYLDAYRTKLEAKNSPFFLEGQVFGPHQAVLIEGHPASSAEMKERNIPINDVAAWYKPLFFHHVRSMLSSSSAQHDHEEFVPNLSYLMRHDRSMCMTMGSIIPSSYKTWFCFVFGWMMPPSMELLKGSRPLEERVGALRKQVYQDFAVPSQTFGDLLQHLDEEFNIYPLLVYPCKVQDQGGFVRLPHNRHKPWSGKVETGFYLNVGIYGVPRAIRQGNERYPTVTQVRKVEAMVRERGGFLHTYVDVLSTRQEFESMFDHSLWRRVRDKYGATDVFPEIYDKVKPEVDPLQFLAEEEEWMSTAGGGSGSDGDVHKKTN